MLMQSIRMAWASVRSNKMRSFLTMLGIIIGVMALVVMVSLVNGATGAVTSQISALGNDLLNVSISDDKGNPIRLEDLMAFTEDETIRAVAPSGSMYTTAKHGYTDVTASVTGTTAAYFSIEGMELEDGRLLKTVDVDNAAYVAVLSHDAKEKLFAGEEAVGKTITLGGRSFTVVGTLKETESLMSAMFSSVICLSMSGSSEAISRRSSMPRSSLNRLSVNRGLDMMPSAPAERASSCISSQL